VTKFIFYTLMLTLRPWLPPPCPDFKTFACSTIRFSRLLMMCEHIELPAKLADYFLRSNKCNTNQNIIEQLVPTVEQHYRSLIGRFVGAASFVELRDAAIYGGPTLVRCVDSFLE